jgi:molybdopterin-guanine dinucleotide biosynthesis adapter protein
LLKTLSIEEEIKMPPIVSIVGKSSSGKTTFLEKLLRELTSRGYKVATIKHSHHSIAFDDPSKDSFRHAQAGAAVTMVSSTTSFQIIKPLPKELTIDELARHLGEEYDLILTEGFSRGNSPKVEVHRKEAGPLLEVASNLFAVATDEPLETETRQFALDNVKGVADLIEEKFIKPNREHISLYINGEKIPLSDFPRQIVTNLLLAMANSLRGVKEVNNLEFRYQKGEKE